MISPAPSCVHSYLDAATVTVPSGLGHRLMEDDVYKGMYIPGGTFVFGNVW